MQRALKSCMWVDGELAPALKGLNYRPVGLDLPIGRLNLVAKRCPDAARRDESQPKGSLKRNVQPQMGAQCMCGPGRPNDAVHTCHKVDLGVTLWLVKAYRESC
eukprot:1411980-Amphidinium_carterae.1